MAKRKQGFPIGHLGGPLERFWKKVDKSGECWIWTAAVNHRGYGDFGIRQPRFGKKPTHMLAHRFSWLISGRGNIPKGMFVCHSCDNPPCVRPDHLFLGTCNDNNQDMIKKGRARKALGFDVPGCKLSDADVFAIRRRFSGGEPIQAIASDFNIVASYAKSIAVGKHPPRLALV